MLAVLCVWFSLFFFLVTCSGLILFWAPLFESRFAQSLQARCRKEWHCRPLPLRVITSSVYKYSTVQPYISQEPCRSGTCHSLVTGEKGMRVQKGGTNLSRCAVVCVILPPLPLPPPVLHRLRSRFSMTVNPHRNSPEQPGESPCIHRLSAAQHSNNYANRHRHMPTHTHTHARSRPWTLHFIRASISVLKWYSASHFTRTH